MNHPNGRFISERRSNENYSIQNMMTHCTVILCGLILSLIVFVDTSNTMPFLSSDQNEMDFCFNYVSQLLEDSFTVMVQSRPAQTHKMLDDVIESIEDLRSHRQAVHSYRYNRTRLCHVDDCRDLIETFSAGRNARDLLQTSLTHHLTLLWSIKAEDMFILRLMLNVFLEEAQCFDEDNRKALKDVSWDPDALQRVLVSHAIKENYTIWKNFLGIYD